MAPSGVRLVLSLAVVALAWRAYGQGDFNLEDAFGDVPTQKPKPAPKPPKIPTHNVDEFDLSDFFDPTKPPKVVPKRPTRKPDVFIATKKPHVTPKPPKKQGYDDFTLEDALDGRNDPKGGGSTINDNDKSQGGRNTGGFDDSDLEGVVDGGYKPDKGKGGSPGGRAADNYDNSDLKIDPTSGSVCEGKDPERKPKNPDSSTNVAIKKVVQNLSLRVLRVQRQLKSMQDLLADLTDLL